MTDIRQRDLGRLLVGGKNPYRAQKNGRKRNIAQRETDLVFIAGLYLKGYTVEQITDELNSARIGQYQMSYEAVRSDIDVIHKRWIASYLVDFDKAKARELAHIDLLEQEYWNAWRRSQEKIEETESEQIKDTQGNERVTQPKYSRTRVKKKEKTRDGQKDFLAGIQWCIEQRCKILGLNMNVSTQNINVNWREEAIAQGIDPDGAVNDLVQQFVSAAQMGRDGDTGSMGEGSKDHP